ncbi:MAG: type II toxin-antitoxin system VapB family antitoxin, partial [Sphingomonas sp.]
MGTQLNIKDAETVRLARALAEELGGSVTAAVRLAIEEKLARQRDDLEQRRARLARIVKGSRDLW